MKKLLITALLAVPFVASAAIPSAPTVGPRAPSFIADNDKFTAEWDHVDGATHYQLLDNGYVVGETTKNKLNHRIKLDNYPYNMLRQLQVKACSLEGCSGVSKSTQVEIYQTPGVPNNFSAQAGSIVGLDVRLSWLQSYWMVPGGKYYMYGPDANGDEALLCEDMVETQLDQRHECTVTVHHYGDNNDYKVKACSPQGKCSDYTTFSIQGF